MSHIENDKIIEDAVNLRTLVEGDLKYIESIQDKLNKKKNKLPSLEYELVSGRLWELERSRTYLKTYLKYLPKENYDKDSHN